MKYNRPVLRFFQKRQTTIVSTITSLTSIFLAFLSNKLYLWLSDTVKGASTNTAKIFFAITIIILTVALLYFLSFLAEFIKNKLWPETQNEKYMKHAFLHLRQLGANRQETFQEFQKTFSIQDTADFLINEAVRNIQLVVQCCFNFFDSAFSETGQLVNDIKFEATFMTKSYIDGEITIPCAANKENRTPVSMLHRDKNPKIFNKTETAKIYGMERPVMILVEDTSKDDEYTETYAKQKARIKSSIILPVLSHQNMILGTLVIHCNKAGFFQNKRYDFWNELVELFSVELGYHKLLLDYYIEKYPDVKKPF